MEQKMELDLKNVLDNAWDGNCAVLVSPPNDQRWPCSEERKQPKVTSCSPQWYRRTARTMWLMKWVPGDIFLLVNNVYSMAKNQFALIRNKSSLSEVCESESQWVAITSVPVFSIKNAGSIEGPQESRQLHRESVIDLLVVHCNWIKLSNIKRLWDDANFCTFLHIISWNVTIIIIIIIKDNHFHDVYVIYCAKWRSCGCVSPTYTIDYLCMYKEDLYQVMFHYWLSVTYYKTGIPTRMFIDEAMVCIEKENIILLFKLRISMYGITWNCYWRGTGANTHKLS